MNYGAQNRPRGMGMSLASNGAQVATCPVSALRRSVEAGAIRKRRIDRQPYRLRAFDAGDAGDGRGASNGLWDRGGLRGALVRVAQIARRFTRAGTR